MKQSEFIITGMSCAACSGRVDKKICSLPGVQSASVNLATNKAMVTYNEENVRVDDIISAVRSIGFGAEEFQENTAEKSRLDELKSHRLSFIVSGILSFPLLVSMVLMLLKTGPEFLHNPVFQFILATPVQFIIGARFYKKSFITLRNLSPGMDILVAMGTSAAYFYSVFNTFVRPDHFHIYYEAGAVVITLVILGKYLESRAKYKTSSSIRKLINLKPKTARVIREGKEYEINSSEIIIGDEIIVRPGEKFPSDGTVISGESSVDESMITGEGIPVYKNAGMKVLSGCINIDGVIHFRSEKNGKDTLLAQIISIVEKAQNSKAPVQDLANRIAGIFAPFIIIISILTFFGWFLITGDLSNAIINSVAVLVIACPCALGLATPTAIMVGTGIGAERGILIRDAEALERGEQINAVVLDKTGTITEGKPSLSSVLSVNETPASDIELIRKCASRSEHPLSKAVSIPIEDMIIDSFTSFPGRGFKAVQSEKNVILGSMRFLESEGIDTGIFENHISANRGSSIIAAAINNKPAALFILNDRIRPESVEAVKTLNERSISVYIVSGDSREAVLAAADTLGIPHDNAVFEALPSQKSDFVTLLKNNGKKVLFAGDGINDAPALATSDLGTALGSGTDIAIDSAHIALIRPDLRAIITALDLSKATMKKIRRNLFWAFFYNSCGIPIAAVGFLNPVIAGAAMALSSVSVVMNSLSLKRFK
ncbi:MAG: copper-translocating P-type ATPase [Spirochaetes bacterium]|nr:copper-translocating P-type ATPase [Spirochaetota bacterium]